MARPGEREQHHADRHRRVGHVEDRPAPLAPADLDEVHHLAAGDAVEQVADRTAEDERQRQAPSAALHAPAQEQGEDGGDGGEREQVVGERQAGADAEGDPRVARVGEAHQIADHRHRRGVLQDARRPALGPEIEGHDPRGDGEQEAERALHGRGPRRPAGAHGLVVHGCRGKVTRCPGRPAPLSPCTAGRVARSASPRAGPG